MTIVAMLVTKAIQGRVDAEEIAGLLYRRDMSGTRPTLKQPAGMESTWLATSQAEVPDVPDYPFEIIDGRPRWFQRPALWTALLLGRVSYLNLVLFW